MKKLMVVSSLILIIMSFKAVQSQESALKADIHNTNTAATVSLNFKYKHEEFTDITANAFVGHPMTVYLSHPSSQNEYKVDLLVSMLEYSGKKAAKVNLSFHKKIHDAWDDEQAIQTLLYLDEPSSFSISDQNQINIIEGEVTVTDFKGEIPEHKLTNTECNDSTVLAQPSCCRVPCQDGGPNSLRCCGGVGCCGCGVCCSVP